MIKNIQAFAGLFLFFLFAESFTDAQKIQIPETITPIHPRLLINQSGKDELKKLIDETSWAKNIYTKAKAEIDPYVNRHQTDSTWIVSRLQMYWKSHATDVFIKGAVYSHATGQAPVPTVRIGGARDATTSYAAPKLEDIVPYMEDDRGLYYANKTKPGNALEWVEPSKTGRVIEAINTQIMGMAKTAAFFYWYTGEEKYAKFARDLFDTYMMGMYYRKEPVDLNHSHNQTLVGMSSFEVIQESVLNELTGCYDFLYNYIRDKTPGRLPLYSETFKKWADLTIKNGVPFNNWNLFEARYILQTALILENNNVYPDGKGFQYYADQIFNNSRTRQWSIPRLLAFGYDPNTGIWDESPGYSQSVINDFLNLVNMFDNTLHYDLLPQLPILVKATTATAQYMFPNGYTVGFGDTHYAPLVTGAIRQMIINAQHFNRPDQEIHFTRMMKMLDTYGKENEGRSEGRGINALLNRAQFSMNDTIRPGKMDDFVTPTFYSPNVSWFVQRNGTDPDHGLMISQAGSKGNHAHSNGIAMELYGKGIVLAPEGGIGTSYFQPDYAEYYSQFPAHNTVVVDGISSYPAMRSSHGFEVLGSYPGPGKKEGYFSPVTFSELYFLEPETNADQVRLMSIIRTGPETGYYIDIFRSARKNKSDKYHDYFFHNLGQEVTVTDPSNKPLDLKPTERLAFADGDLFAYDYLWDKKSITTDQDFKAQFTLKVPGKDNILMNMWMKGSPDREIFLVKSPATKAFGRGMLNDSITALPVPAIVARQKGEAWTRPFVAVYEPATSKEPASIATVNSFMPVNVDAGFVGLEIKGINDSRQTVFTSVNMSKPVQYNTKTFQGSYGVISEDHSGLKYLFMTKGKQIGFQNWIVRAQEEATSALEFRDNGMYFTTDKTVTLTIPDTFQKGRVILKAGEKSMEGKRSKINGTAVISFDIPAMNYQKILMNGK